MIDNLIHIIQNIDAQLVNKTDAYHEYKVGDYFIYLHQYNGEFLFTDNHFNSGDKNLLLNLTIGYLPSTINAYDNSNSPHFAEDISPSEMKNKIIALSKFDEKQKDDFHKSLQPILYRGKNDDVKYVIYNDDKIVNIATYNSSQNETTYLNHNPGYSKLYNKSSENINLFTNSDFIPYYNENQNISDDFLFISSNSQLTIHQIEEYLTAFKSINIHSDSKSRNTFQLLLNLINLYKDDYKFKTELNGSHIDLIISHNDRKTLGNFSNKIQRALHKVTTKENPSLYDLSQHVFSEYRGVQIITLPCNQLILEFVGLKILELIKLKNININEINIQNASEKLNNYLMGEKDNSTENIKIENNTNSDTEEEKEELETTEPVSEDTDEEQNELINEIEDFSNEENDTSFDNSAF